MPPQNAPVWLVALSVLGDLVLRQTRERQAPICGCSVEEEPKELELCRVDAVRAAERIGRAESELALVARAPKTATLQSPTTSNSLHFFLCALPGVISFIGHFTTYCRARRPVRRNPHLVDKPESSTDDEVLAARASARALCR